MKKAKKVISVAFCALLVFSFASCDEEIDRSQFWYEGVKSENKKFSEITGEYFHDSLKDDALNLHFDVKNLSDYGFERPEMDLLSESVVDVNYVENMLESMKKLDYDKLSRSNQITYDLIKEDLEEALSFDYTDWGSYFDYSSGFHSSLLTIATEYEFFVEEDVSDYISMLNQVSDYFDYVYELEEERVEEGYGLTDFVLDDVEEQMRSIYSEGENSCLIASFDERIDALDFISDTKKGEYKTLNREAVLNGVLPAYENTCKKLENFKGKGRDNVGICFLDEGRGYYEYLVKSKSSTDESLDELSKKLEDFIDYCSAEVSKVARTMSADAINQWLYGDQGAMTDANEILDFFSSNLGGYFPEIEGTSYTIKYLSESVANTMPSTLAYYLVPQIDNYKKGAITINGYATDESGMMNTLAHEGYPGHLYQNVYFMSTNPDPARILHNFSGYTEGWAVYAANQAEFIYKYPKYSKQFATLNSLNVSYSYALYALCDIGVNYLGWSSSYLNEFLGFGDEDYAENFRNIFIEMPGVYLSYGVGNMKMEEMRTKAETLAGKSFDAVDYHELILKVGPCNFSLLERMIEEYYTFNDGQTE